MSNNILRNYINKYFSSKSKVEIIKVSLTFISIMIYIWFFCLFIILYRFIIVNLFAIFHLTPFSTVIYDTIGYGSPIFYGPNILLDIISSPGLMSFYGIVFGILTTLILVLFIVWIIIQGIFFISWAAYVSPFTELMDTFKVIMGKTTFTSFAFKNIQALFSIFLSFFRKKESFQNYEGFQNFNMQLMFQNLMNKYKYITELQKNHYEKAKKHYEDEKPYFINVAKAREHTRDANILKSLAIPTSKQDQMNADITNQNIAITKSIESAMKF